MKTLRITGVPEHFNLPWKKVISRQPFFSKGIELKWTEESRGSGQMNKAIREGETDIALILTESFLQDFENGSPAKMMGFHVSSPLIWGIHVHGNSTINALDQIDSPSFLISRNGSGSQLMSYVLAKRENWDSENLTFRIVGNLPGALQVMSPEKPEMFLWEKYTTKPWVDSREMKRIGEVLSPWPCFAMVVSNTALEEFGEIIFELRQLVYQESSKLQDSESTAEEIHKLYDLKLEDVKSWLSQTQWAKEAIISKKELNQAMEEMIQLGILKNKLRLEDFLTMDHLTLTL